MSGPYSWLNSYSSGYVSSVPRGPGPGGASVYSDPSPRLIGWVLSLQLYCEFPRGATGCFKYRPVADNPCIRVHEEIMNSEDILDHVETSIETLIHAGTPHHGLFPSILDRETGDMLAEMPENVPGQRDHDRAPRGCNPIHDTPVLEVMYTLADIDDRPEYAEAADRYLERFATHCTGTATGLIPWGEHAYWDLDDDCMGNGNLLRDPDHPSYGGRVIHDHRRLVPAWLWEKLCEYNEACLHDYADGLRYHWYNPERPRANRHAPIDVKDRYTLDGGSAFPRHGGHYIHDWTVAYTKEPHPEYLRQIRKMSDHWWDFAGTESGLLRKSGDTLYIHQTCSLAISLLDAAEILETHDVEPELRGRMRERADIYLEGCMNAPHDLENNLFLSMCRERDLREGEFEPLTGPDVDAPIVPKNAWAQAYGRGGPVSKEALWYLCAYRHTGTDELLEWAEAAGRFYRENPPPSDGIVPFEEADIGMTKATKTSMERGEDFPIYASTVGLTLGLYADLYDVTGEAEWLDAGFDLAETAIDVFLDASLPRGASTVDHYESQLGTGYLLYNLTWLALLDRDGRNSAPGPNYTER